MTERIPAKHCTTCGEYKPLTEYAKARDGRRAATCKDCKAAYSRDRYMARRDWLWEQKSKPCMDCGLEWPPYVMQFDHVPDRGSKLFGVEAHAVSKRTRDEVLAEIAKCDLVCANCHFIRTHDRRTNL